MQGVQPQNGYILFNTGDKPMYGAFKSMREGQIDLVGPHPFPTIGGATLTTALVAIKQTYQSNFSHSSDLSAVAVPTLSISPEQQIKDLAADALSIQWATALLQDVYDFIALYHQSHETICPVKIPPFQFVKSGLAITNAPGLAPERKEVYLIEELIQPKSDGPWRKYINNNSSLPRSFPDNENRRQADFLAFCQHVQYWRTGRQAFTTDFQGMSVFDLLLVFD